MHLLQDRIALVTGSSRGIGASIARLFAAQGARVVVHGRYPDTVAAVQAEIEQAGGRAFGATADLTRSDQVDSLREVIEDRVGPVDILVANAAGGTIRPGPLEDITEAEFQECLDTNLTTVFRTIKAFLPGMKERRRGSILTVSSAAARRPTAQSPIAYTAAKAGVELLTRQVALQAGSSGVRANCLAPETILTEGNRERIPQDVQEKLALMHPIPRLGLPEDVAEAALFLASDRAPWISGVVLDVAGGSVIA